MQSVDSQPLLQARAAAAQAAGAFSLIGGSDMLRVLARTLLVVALVNGSIQAFYLGVAPRFGSIFALALSLAIFALLKREAVQQAAWLFTVGLVVVVVAATTLGGSGPFESAWVGLPIAAIVAGWFFGSRAAFAICAAGLLCLWGTFALFVRGMPFTPPEPAISVSTYSIATLMGTVIGAIASRSFSGQLAQVTKLSVALHDANEVLEQRVAARTAELTRTLEQLRSAQLVLLENEKLAALGSMVAGISHELNTPIGSAVTITSSLKASVTLVSGQLANGTLRKSDLESHMRDVLEMAEILERVMQRSSDIIANFKRVAEDQTSERRRLFDLHEVVRANLSSLLPSFKEHAFEMRNRLAPGITCDSYPGPIGQIIGNLLQNALIHGLEGRQGGRIEIWAEADVATVSLHVEDNGRGMDAVVLSRVFDPFFTTRLGKGGSGLGLSISKRIANTVLGGDLGVVSEADRGTRFTLKFPRTAPGQNLVESGAGLWNFGQDRAL